MRLCVYVTAGKCFVLPLFVWRLHFVLETPLGTKDFFQEGNRLLIVWFFFFTATYVGPPSCKTTQWYKAVVKVVVVVVSQLIILPPSTVEGSNCSSSPLCKGTRVHYSKALTNYCLKCPSVSWRHSLLLLLWSHQSNVLAYYSTVPSKIAMPTCFIREKKNSKSIRKLLQASR